ncbi:hypothetical protein NDU88_006763 [Pleurodeles waltl]|uniref:Uncharacterized protein n=1 Tax=Pleurodeles waltl TaxID=8319 RepID=A0AAV7TY21_PLEWA|nr:hypothetical protein NDU88_006763 [Pleurodeles waltl]
MAGVPPSSSVLSRSPSMQEAEQDAVGGVCVSTRADAGNSDCGRREKARAGLAYVATDYFIVLEVVWYYLVVANAVSDSSLQPQSGARLQRSARVLIFSVPERPRYARSPRLARTGGQGGEKGEKGCGLSQAPRLRAPTLRTPTHRSPLQRGQVRRKRHAPPRPPQSSAGPRHRGRVVEQPQPPRCYPQRLPAPQQTADSPEPNPVPASAQRHSEGTV